MHQESDRGFKHVVNGRAVQLDGVRAIAMIAICWDHWCPAGWPRVFPFEVFLFLFLVLTGYLITGSLLRERDRSEERGGAWKAAALKTYQIRRGLRILAPYYAALALAWIVRAPDMIGSGLPWYVFHLSNFHMALLGHWPAGTNHFWSLAIQQQFYLIWPFVIWFLPRKLLVPAIVAFTAMGPVSRMFHDFFLPWFAWPQLLTWACFDYFGIGALFALAVHRGMSLESPALRWLAVARSRGLSRNFRGARARLADLRAAGDSSKACWPSPGAASSRRPRWAFPEFRRKSSNIRPSSKSGGFPMGSTFFTISRRW